MEVRVAVAKIHKYAVSMSGDTVEITERPKGGLSVILADGQGSGKSAKQNSNLVVAKGVAMIGEGARDGAVARAVHDMFYAARDGKVSAELIIASVDTATHTIVISRNTACPVLVHREGATAALEGTAGPIGVRASTKPLIDVLPLEPLTTVLGFSDGIWHAGRTYSNQWSTEELAALVTATADNPDKLVDTILSSSLERDKGRPRDDMAVFALAIRPRLNDAKTRRLTATLPI